MAKRESEVTERTSHVMSGSDNIHDLFCDVCSEDGVHLEAEGFCIDCQDFLCRDCFKGHRGSRACRHHTLQDKTHMPRKKPTTLLVDESDGKCVENCAHHRDRVVEYYCMDDKTLGCSACMTVKHRQCKGVQLISDITELLLDSQEFKQFTIGLENMKDKAKSVIQEAENNISEAEKWFDDSNRWISEIREQRNEAFTKCEQDFKEKANAIKLEDVKKIKELSDKGKTVLGEVENILSEIKLLQDKNKVGQLFIEMKKFEENMENLQKLLDDADVYNSLTVYYFEPGLPLLEIIDDPASIGQLSFKVPGKLNSNSNEYLLSAQPYMDSSFSYAKQKAPRLMRERKTSESIAHTIMEQRKTKTEFVRNINIRTTDGKNNCLITGSVVLPGDRLVLADNENCKLALLQRSKVTSQLKMAGRPWDVTNISRYQVAATLMDISAIAFVKVTDALKEDRQIAVDGECRAILYARGKIFVSFVEPAKIDIMTLDGTVLKTIDEPSLFDWPTRIACSADHDFIYVADHYCIKKITLEGNVESVYKDRKLRSPRGIIVDQHGRVLVCCATSKNIHLLSADLTQIKVFAGKELQDCQSLSYCHNTDMFYVGLQSDEVKVFQLS